MKIFITVLTFLFLSLEASGQHLTRSTLREIYNFDVGDTLEYSYGYTSCDGWLCQEYGNIMKLVLSKQVDTNSVTYTFLVNTLAIQAPCNGPYYIGQDSAISTVTYYNLDSLVFGYDTVFQGSCDTFHNCTIDSVYMDTAMQDRKVDLKGYNFPSCCGADSSFADSVGLLSASSGSEDNTECQGGIGLVYYHKANGDVWGTSYLWSPTAGIRPIQVSMGVCVAPNPAADDFVLTFSAGFHDGDLFELTDALGRTVMQQTIHSPSTVIQRPGISDGLYFWHVQDSSSDFATGKILLRR